MCRLRTKKSSTCTSLATSRTAASLSSLRSPFTVSTTSGRSPLVRLMEHAKPYRACRFVHQCKLEMYGMTLKLPIRCDPDLSNST